MSARSVVFASFVLLLAAGATAQQPPERGDALAPPTPEGRSATPSQEGGEAPSDAPPDATSEATGAETGSALDDPRARPRAERPEAPAERTEAPAEPWGGPRVELGYAHYAIVDGFGGGGVHAGLFGGYVPAGRVRLGGNAELGVHDYSLGQDDALLRATLIVGYQHLPLRPFLPYAGVVGTAGLLIGKRFRTPVTRGILGAGLEVGADLNLARSLYVGVGLSYLRASVDGTGHDLWVVRLRIGL